MTLYTVSPRPEGPIFAEKLPLEPGSRLQSLHEVAFSMNLVTAIAYAMLVYVYTHDLDYYLLRAAVRVDDFLHFPQSHAVTTEALRRQSQNIWSQFAGMELTILVSMFAAMIVVLLFLRISPNAWYRVIMGTRCSGFFTLFGLPLARLSLHAVLACRLRYGRSEGIHALVLASCCGGPALCCHSFPHFPSAPTLNMDNRYSSSFSLCVLVDRYVATTAFPRRWSVDPFDGRFPLFGSDLATPLGDNAGNYRYNRSHETSGQVDGCECGLIGCNGARNLVSGEGT
jgi:hypothetical protein